MTADEFRIGIEKLGISQRRFAEIAGIPERSMRRWLAGDNDVPVVVAVLLSLLVSRKLDLDDVARVSRKLAA